MHCWKLGASKPFNLGTMYHFIAILYYFGLVRLPSKRDCWTSEEWMPKHRITKDFGMSKDRFFFLWRFFHVGGLTSNDDQEASEDKDEEELVEFGLFH